MSVPRFTLSSLRPSRQEETRKCIYYDFLHVFPAYYCAKDATSEDSLYCAEHEKEQEEKKKTKQSKLYTIEKIVGKKLELEGNKWQVYYNIKWLGYPSAENTWEPKESLEKTAKETVEDYEQQYKQQS